MADAIKAHPITLYNSLQLSKLARCSRLTIQKRYRAGELVCAAVDAAGKPLFTADAARMICEGEKP